MKYQTAKYTTGIELDKSPAEVFGQLIDLKKWWPEDFEGEDLRLNSEFVLTSGGSHESINKVTALVPGKKLTWLVTKALRKSDGFDWTGTQMIFELTTKGNKTLLQFTYDGVVLEHEASRLVQICDMTLKELFYNTITNER